MKKEIIKKECILCKSKKALRQFKKSYICNECIDATKQKALECGID